MKLNVKNKNKMEKDRAVSYAIPHTTRHPGQTMQSTVAWAGHPHACALVHIPKRKCDKKAPFENNS